MAQEFEHRTDAQCLSDTTVAYSTWSRAVPREISAAAADVEGELERYSGNRLLLYSTPVVPWLKGASTVLYITIVTVPVGVDMVFG